LVAAPSSGCFRAAVWVAHPSFVYFWLNSHFLLSPWNNNNNKISKEGNSNYNWQFPSLTWESIKGNFCLKLGWKLTEFLKLPYIFFPFKGQHFYFLFFKKMWKLFSHHLCYTKCVQLLCMKHYSNKNIFKQCYSNFILFFNFIFAPKIGRFFIFHYKLTHV
jgi:hypothetical protein